MAIKKVQTRQSRNVLKYDFIELGSISINAGNTVLLRDICSILLLLPILMGCL